VSAVAKEVPQGSAVVARSLATDLPRLRGVQTPPNPEHSYLPDLVQRFKIKGLGVTAQRAQHCTQIEPWLREKHSPAHVTRAWSVTPRPSTRICRVPQASHSAEECASRAPYASPESAGYRTPRIQFGRTLLSAAQLSLALGQCLFSSRTLRNRLSANC
jgi:hypothetical protein